MKYPLLLICGGDLTPPRIRVFDASGTLVAHATGATFAWKDHLTLFGDAGGSQILAKVRAESPGPLPSYAITTGEDKLLGSVRPRSVSIWRQQRDLRDGADAPVGIVSAEPKSRPAEGAVTRIPILGPILSRITILDMMYTIEMPAGTKVLEARYRRSWTTHRFEVQQLGDISRHEELVLPTLAILLLWSVRASQS